MPWQFKGTNAEKRAQEMEALTRPFRLPGVTFRLTRNVDDNKVCTRCDDNGYVAGAPEPYPCAACERGYLAAEKLLTRPRAGSALIRLDPPEWLVFDLEPGEQPEPGWIPIKPIAGKNGLYGDRLRKRVWLEWEGCAWAEGMAWSPFKYHLDLLNAPVYRDCELAAFHTVWPHLAPATQRKVWLAEEAKRLRQIEREAQLFVARED